MIKRTQSVAKVFPDFVSFNCYQILNQFVYSFMKLYEITNVSVCRHCPKLINCCVVQMCNIMSHFCFIRPNNRILISFIAEFLKDKKFPGS